MKASSEAEDSNALLTYVARTCDVIVRGVTRTKFSCGEREFFYFKRGEVVRKQINSFFSGDYFYSLVDVA